MPDFFESVLDPEQEFYEAGLAEGLAEAAAALYREGLEFGYQTGFQRWVFVGWAQGFVQLVPHQYPEKWASLASLQRQAAAISALVDSLETLNLDRAVAHFERTLPTLRNKMRVLGHVVGFHGDLVKHADAIVQRVAGTPSAAPTAEDGGW